MAAEEPDDRQGRHDEAAAFLLGDSHALPAFFARIDDYQPAVAADRPADAEDRTVAARDRELADWARQSAGGLNGTPAAGRRDVRGASDAGVLARRTELDVALRLATAREAEALEFAEHAVTLAARVADSEQQIAETLRGVGDRPHSERRHALADEAVRGASKASERGERLRVLADQAKDHLQKATVRALLSNAAAAVAELGRAQWAVAEAFGQLAEREEGEVAAAHGRAAQEAATAADEAARRAAELHRLEVGAL